MNILKRLPLTADFLSDVVALDQRCFGGLWSLDAYQRELASPNSDLIILVASSTNNSTNSTEETVVGLGCLWAILEEAHITILAVDPAHQGRGLGKLLLSELLLAAQRRALERATLEVRASNDVALHLYGKLDFRQAGRRRRYYSDGEDALILWRGGLQTTEFNQQFQKFKQQLESQLDLHGWRLESVII
ncbi:MAG: ribosomal protein S18-alanine N-acetyltransferase [Leptolyngbyaceae cyanobacterium MO_188.B28]|nr:ribosomal protein S18-alanine N-acetyltransferase [Leptolyngbyaceae cyanobacterium MO_188.B28]